MADFGLGDGKLYACLNPSTSPFSTGVGGGIDVSNQITGASIGEVHFPVTPNPISGSTILFNKFFMKNTNTTSSAFSCLIYMNNYIKAPSSLGSISAYSTSSSDDSGFKIRISGFASGASFQVDLALNGISIVSTSSGFDEITTIEFYSSTNVLSFPSGNIIILDSSSVTLGMIPAGIQTAQSMISIGIESTIDGTTTIADATTPPSVPMSSPNNIGSALLFSNSGLIPPGSAQGIWSCETVPAMTQSISLMKVSIIIQANTAA